MYKTLMAKEMFEQLGFTMAEKPRPYKVYYEKEDPIEGYIRIGFSDGYVIPTCNPVVSTNPVCLAHTPMVCSLDGILLNAINKQMEELGWDSKESRIMNRYKRKSERNK